MEDNYTKAYTEVLTVLKYLPKESVNKIPNQMLEMFEANRDRMHVCYIDINKSFAEQNLLEETKAIFANIFRDFWATPEQRERIIAKEKRDRQKIEEEKRGKYNPDKIFKQNEVKNEEVEASTNLPIEIKKESFYNKLINFFKRLFHL